MNFLMFSWSIVWIFQPLNHSTQTLQAETVAN